MCCTVDPPKKPPQPLNLNILIPQLPSGHFVFFFAVPLSPYILVYCHTPVSSPIRAYLVEVQPEPGHGSSSSTAAPQLLLPSTVLVVNISCTVILSPLRLFFISHHADILCIRRHFFQPAIWIGAAIQTPFGTTTVKRSYAPPLLFCCLVTEIEVKAWCRVELLKKAKKKEERRGRGKNIEQVPALHCTAINFAQAHRHTV